AETTPHTRGESRTRGPRPRARRRAASRPCGRARDTLLRCARPGSRTRTCRASARARARAPQPLEQALDPPGLVAAQDELGVRARAEGRPRGAQFLRRGLPVVDFAVVD